MRGVLLAVDGHDQAVDAAVLEQVDGVGLLAGLAVGIDEVEREAASAQFGVRRLEGGGMQRIGDIVDDEADREGIAPAHVLRPRIGLEIECLDRGADLAERRRPDRIRGVQTA